MQGVVGSTSNILSFILDKVKEAHEQRFDQKLKFVLGTETGMITSIHHEVQLLLNELDSDLEVEVVFPVSAESMTPLSSNSDVPGSFASLAMVPGPQGTEGCSASGYVSVLTDGAGMACRSDMYDSCFVRCSGCASCPYMKMNSLSALLQVCEELNTADEASVLGPFKPKEYQEALNGKTLWEAGVEPITHMRHFQTNRRFSDELLEHISTGSTKGA
eukprot:scaffold927_cov375-Prasinococcus_capsulatus_cf.AAC.10